MDINTNGSRPAAQSAGLFNCRNCSRLERLLRGAIPRDYAPGEPVFYEGNPALAVYCLAGGEIKLWRLGPHGDAHVLATRGEGDLLGARAVIANGYYTVTAEPLVRSRLYTIRSADFLEALSEDLELAHGLLTRMAKVTIETEDRLLARSVEHVRQRTARLLLGFAPSTREDEGASAELHGLPKRRDMALLIGTTPETLSRTLHTLVLRGILELEQDRIIIRDICALRRIAR